MSSQSHTVEDDIVGEGGSETGLSEEEFEDGRIYEEEQSPSRKRPAPSDCDDAPTKKHRGDSGMPQSSNEMISKLDESDEEEEEEKKNLETWCSEIKDITTTNKANAVNTINRLDRMPNRGLMLDALYHTLKYGTKGNIKRAKRAWKLVEKLAVPMFGYSDLIGLCESILMRECLLCEESTITKLPEMTEDINPYDMFACPSCRDSNLIRKCTAEKMFNMTKTNLCKDKGLRSIPDGGSRQKVRLFILADVRTLAISIHGEKKVAKAEKEYAKWNVDNVTGKSKVAVGCASLSVRDRSNPKTEEEITTLKARLLGQQEIVDSMPIITAALSACGKVPTEFLDSKAELYAKLCGSGSDGDIETKKAISVKTSILGIGKRFQFAENYIAKAELTFPDIKLLALCQLTIPTYNKLVQQLSSFVLRPRPQQLDNFDSAMAEILAETISQKMALDEHCSNLETTMGEEHLHPDFVSALFDPYTARDVKDARKVWMCTTK